MREIKFRAWVKFNYGPWGSHFKMMYQGTPDLETLQSFMFHYGAEEKLMQFTGLKDKNGKDIYEGDIIRYFNLLGELAIGIIVFKDGSFRFKNTNNQEARQWNDGDHDWYSIENIELFEMEIIGNIYENPELLNK